MNRLINKLPIYERNSKVFQELMKAEELELDKIELDIEDLKKQLFIDTATWGLDLYEKELKIPIDLSKDLEERRGVIRSKWRGTGKVDKYLIKRVVDAYTNGNVDVSFNGKIVIKFTGIYGIPTNLNDVYKSLEDVSPAHLDIIYEFMYLYIKDIHEVMTIEELENTTLDKFAF
ncbi:putative phage tail protein [Tissierella creatinophila]|uniref:Phage portal protein n=1 Tax=Tissierella creatinophila DSM 6911 TaxID=1123403 RepID=A0A1U7M4I9_TISCR|nr:putative phage tail protein [Tissierella creatinophila]OLS02232.1 hypothetical protein TICRE_17840 [Tissierella creatinophila DSM 6911]